MIAHAKDKLSLNTMQQGMFDTALAHAKAAVLGAVREALAQPR